MCNLYYVRATEAEIRSYFQASDDWRRDLTMTKHYTAPGKPGYVVRAREGRRLLSVMSWGFLFNGRPVTNVRNYTSPFWMSALTNPARRCLVPVTEFQEWSVEPDPFTRKNVPHWFSLQSRPIFAFAGIWRPTVKAPVFSFLTTGYDGDPAAHVVGAIHPHACPVILHEEDYDRWLQSELDDALSLASTFPSQLIAEV